MASPVAEFMVTDSCPCSKSCTLHRKRRGRDAQCLAPCTGNAEEETHIVVCNTALVRLWCEGCPMALESRAKTQSYIAS
jgi:hypothetical protein